MPLQDLGRQHLNPFINSTPRPGFLEWLKIIFLFPTLGIVRLLFIIIILLLVAIWSIIFTAGAKKEGPLPAWRSLPVRVVVSFFARAILFLLGFYWIPVTGKRASSKVIRTNIYYMFKKRGRWGRWESAGMKEMKNGKLVQRWIKVNKGHNNLTTMKGRGKERNKGFSVP